MFNFIQAAQIYNNDLYWEALVQIANNNKSAALQIVESIKNDSFVKDNSYPWQQDQPEDINAFFDKLFINFICNDPQALTLLNLFESIGIQDHNAHLTDISPQALVDKLEKAKINLKLLNNYSIDKLTPEQKTSHKIFSWMLNHTVSGERFLFHPYKISQLEGFIIDLSMLLTQFHKLETKIDFENYISRLNKIPEQFKQAIEFIELQKNHGIIPPQFTIEKIITLIDNSIPEQINKNAFYIYFDSQLQNLDCPNRDKLLSKMNSTIKDIVYPAYKNLHDYFIKLLSDAKTNNGAWALPNGDDYYKYMLYHHTTTNLSAEEIHLLGLQEVAKIQTEIRKILAETNIVNANKSIGAIIQEIAKDPQFYYPNTHEGRQQCLADYEAIIKRSRKELAHLFEMKPTTDVTIQQVPEHEEDGAPSAYYYSPSADGSRPGTFFANLRNMNEIPKYHMETLAIHEAEPGHHFQLALQFEMDIPMLRKLESCTAYCEGWALYTEKLAYENNFYSSSFSKLGHLQDELLRAARLVVDTGIHYKRWSKEKAIAYLEETTGYHHDSVVSEIERYFVIPGQACSYKIGQLKILELRQKAKDALKELFDIREFHNEILQLGTAPLTILEDVINNYIQRKLTEAFK